MGVRLFIAIKWGVIPSCHGPDPLPELVAQLAQETYSTDLLFYLLQNIHKLEFESRKDVVQIFNNLLRRQIGARWPTVEYLCSKPEVLFAAFEGYGNEEIALNTGMILREMLRHEPLAKILLYSEQYVTPILVLGASLTRPSGSTSSHITSRTRRSAYLAMPTQI